MKIGIISDTHDNLDRVEQAMEIFQTRGVEEVIHCGDFVAPFVPLKMKAAGFSKIHAVYGNNDGELLMLNAVFKDTDSIQKQPAFITIAGVSIAVMHEPMPPHVMDALPVDVVCYGHTHDAVVRNGKPVIINPGECCGWLRRRATVAILDSETIQAELIELP